MDLYIIFNIITLTFFLITVIVAMTNLTFSNYLKIIGKGMNMSRPLEQAEAKDTAVEIFSNKAGPM